MVEGGEEVCFFLKYFSTELSFLPYVISVQFYRDKPLMLMDGYKSEFKAILKEKYSENSINTICSHF